MSRDTLSHPRRPRSLRPAAVALAGLALAGLIWLSAGEIGRERATAQVAERADAVLASAASVMRSEIGKQRAVPIVLAEDPEVASILEAPSPSGLERMNRRLKTLVQTTGASVLYIVRRDGLAVASSNYDEPQSFVGNDYRFRHYVAASLAQGGAEQYALGSVSRRPGLYIARRVGTKEAPLGVAVLKVELDAVEDIWRASGGTIFADDERGVIVATTRPDWRYRTLRSLPAGERDAIRETLQFGEAPLTPLEALVGGDGTQVRIDDPDGGTGAVSYMAGRALGDPVLPWRLHLLLPADAVLAENQRFARLVGFAAALAVLAPGFALWRRRRRLLERQRELTATAQELERRVDARTREIAETNRRLREEMDARLRSERRAGELREELDQAARLATLGQIAAGVAHEINQPLAAIRTYGENAGLFLERGEAARTADNLKLVIGLTDRIGAITSTLRNFSRRGSQPVGPVLLRSAAEGARMLLHNRFSAVSVRLEETGDAWDRTVVAEPIRLEQVLVNLLQNALDAVGDRPDARITLTAAREGERVRLAVADNGPGIDPAVLPRLFTPFSTAKPRGLGLGLVIARDILAEWGGDLQAESQPGKGATFTARLCLAPEQGHTR